MINEADLEFLNTVWSRRPYLTYFFFGVNIVVFLLMTFAGGTTNNAILLAFGAKANVLINRGEYWRFVTPVFIHIGLLHLFFNSYALWIVGPQVEKLYGGARFVLLYVVTGVAGVAASYWYRPGGVSAGASGAIFGLFGVLFVFGLRYRHHIPPFFRRAVGTGVLPVIVINLIIGFTIPAIDNSAHLGGLLAGMALAAVIPFERPGSRTPAAFRVVQIALLGLVVFSFGEIVLHYNGPSLAFQNAYRTQSPSQGFIDAIGETQQALNESAKALNLGQKAEIKKAILQLGTAIDKLKDIPSLSLKSDALASQILALTQDQYELLKDVDRAGVVTLMHAQRAARNAQKYRQLDEALNSWVAAEGERYGIQLHKPSEGVK